MASGPKGKPAIPITREMWVGRSLSSSRPSWSLKPAHTELPPRPKGKGRPAAYHKGRSFAVRRQLCYCLLLIKKINTLQKNLAKSNHPLVDIFTAQNRIPKGLIGNKLENITHPQGVSNPGDMPTEHTQEFYSSYHNDTEGDKCTHNKEKKYQWKRNWTNTQKNRMQLQTFFLGCLTTQKKTGTKSDQEAIQPKTHNSVQEL